MKRFILFAVLLIVLAFATAPQSHRAATKVLDPMQAGPFPVGVTTTVRPSNKSARACSGPVR